MSIVIAAPSDSNQSWLNPFKEYAPHYGFNQNDVEVWPNVADNSKAKYLIVWKPPHNICEQLPNVEIIFNLGAGVDHILLDATIPNTIPIVRMVDENLTKRMGEYVCLHCLYHLRSVNHSKSSQKQAIWDHISHPTASQVTVGIMGLGEIGSHCAALLNILGFNVIGWSNSKKHIKDVTSFVGAQEREAFLHKTDILVNLLPHTKQTDKLVNYQLLGQLSKTSVLGGPIFINAGRGKSQDEAGILKALKDHTLKAASIDVFENEPLSKESPLWALENLLITPHNAASSDRITITKQILAQIKNHQNGNSLENVVNRAKGY